MVFNIHCNLDMLLRVGQPWVWPQGCSKGKIRHLTWKALYYFCTTMILPEGRRSLSLGRIFSFLHFVSATLPVDPSDWTYKFAKFFSDFLISLYAGFFQMPGQVHVSFDIIVVKWKVVLIWDRASFYLSIKLAVLHILSYFYISVKNKSRLE